MHILRYTLLLLIIGLAGCGQKTTLILLPDDSGTGGKAALQTSEGEVVVDKPYTVSTVTYGGILPSLPQDISPAEVEKNYGNLLASQPPQPVSFLLYFDAGSTLLTEQSKEDIPAIINSVNKNYPYEISIIGHTDAVGQKEYNQQLSLKRAETVKKMLLDRDPTLTNITVQSYGENDPLVPTGDGMAEPRNRRVEIMIR